MRLRPLTPLHLTGLAFGLALCGPPLVGGPAPEPAPWHWAELPPLPDPVGFAGMYAGASGGALVAAGGTNFSDRPFAAGGKKVWHDSIFVLARPDGRWEGAGRLPRPSAYGVSGTWRNAVVCAGGCDAATNFSAAWLMRWNGRAIEFESLPDLPIPVADACGAVVGDIFYVIGGQEAPNSGSALARVFALDLARPPTGRRWEDRPWPAGAPGRIYAVAGALDGRLFLFSGCAVTAALSGKPGTRDLTDAYAFREGEGWRRLADLPSAVASAPGPAVEIDPTHLLVAVPVDTAAKPSGPAPAFVEYEPAADRWRVFYRAPADPTVRVARFDTAIVPWRGRRAMINGETAAGIRTPTVLSLEPGP